MDSALRNAKIVRLGVAVLKARRVISPPRFFNWRSVIASSLSELFHNPESGPQWVSEKDDYTVPTC